MGGVRAAREDVIAITTRAQSITVAKDASLASPELVLVAQDGIQVAEGARLSGTGKPSARSSKALDCGATARY